MNPEDESALMRAIRQVPEELQDDAWKFAASRWRPIREPTIRDVREICGEIVARYGRRSNSMEQI